MGDFLLQQKNISKHDLLLVETKSKPPFNV